MQEKSMKQRLTRVVFALLLAGCILMGNTPNVYAENDTFYAEYLAKKAAGIEVYEIVSEDGVLMGYFQPYSDTNPQTVQAQTASTSYIDWEISANSHACGVNTYSLRQYDNVEVKISQSPSGAGCPGYIGLKDVDTGVYGFANETISTNGWDGVLLAAYDGNFAFAIKNDSPYKIRYTGRYSILE